MAKLIPTELPSNWKDNATQIANRIRLRVLEHVLTNNGGYMSQACSSGELFAALYTRILNLKGFPLTTILLIQQEEFIMARKLLKQIDSFFHRLIMLWYSTRL